MRVKVTYRNLDDETITRLLNDENVVAVEKSTDIDEDIIGAIKDWLNDNEVEGLATSYVYKLFYESPDAPAVISPTKFNRIVRSCGYLTKNVRIGDHIQYCFVKKES